MRGGGIERIVAVILTSVVVACNDGANVPTPSQGSDQQLDTLISQVGVIDARIADPHVAQQEKNALGTQRTSLVYQACEVYFKISSPTNNQNLFATANCDGGSPAWPK